MATTKIGVYQGGAYGASSSQNSLVFQPPKHAYSKIIFYGQNSGVYVNKIWGRNIDMTQSIYNHYLLSYTPSWDLPTYILADFATDSGVNPVAGNIRGTTNALDKMYLYRFQSTGGYESLNITDRNLIGIFDSGNFISTYTDYTAPNKTNWVYAIFFDFDAFSSNQFVTPDAIQSIYSGFFLIDVENEISYKIDVDVSDDGKTLNTLYTKHETNTQYPVFTVGKSNYFSNSFGGMLLKDQTDVYSNDLDLLKAFREFITSSRKKLFKNRKGEIFDVFTSDYTESQVDVKIANQPYLCKFTMTEIGEVK